MKVSILSFSSRSMGNCAAMAAYLKHLYGDDATVYSFHEFQLTACGNCNNDCFAGRERCPHRDDMALTLYEAVMNSDVSYYIVPNYSGYPCSNFFVFSERGLCSYWGEPQRMERYSRARKKFIVVSNSGEEELGRAFRYHSEGESELLVLGSRQYGAAMAENPAAQQAIRQFIL